MRYHATHLIFVLAVIVVPSRAQVSDSCMTVIVSPTVDGITQMLQAAKGQSDAAKKQAAIGDARRFFSQTLSNTNTLWACAGTLDKNFAGILESRRIDKQVGATSSGSGSTSLVPSGSVPALLGLAVEYGGLTEAFSGTTVTFRTTPAKLLGAMANVYGPNANPPSDNTMAVLERVSLSVSFDTSRTDSASTGTGSNLQANYQQLSQTTMRVVLIDDRDPLAPKNWRKIRELSVSTPSQNVANQGREPMEPLTKLSGFDTALDKAMGVFDKLDTDNPDQSALKSAFTTYLEDIHRLTASIPDWQQRVDAYAAARLALDQKHKQLYNQIAKAPSLSFEYDLNRPPAVSTTTATNGTTVSTSAVTAPDLSTTSLVYVASLFGSEYTLNATANLFNQIRPGMSGDFRDFQVAGKWDIPVGRLPSFVVKGTLTLSGLYEHLHQKPLGIALTVNNQDVNQPGNIGIFQAKYSIPLGESGIQIPISFTAANRTELIKEKDMRGNFGITFDLDKLLTKK